MKELGRKLAVLAAVAVCLLSPVLQARFDVGLGAAEFASDGDETLRAAGYAFAFWGLIYAGLVVFALYQLLPLSDGSKVVRRAAWPAAGAAAGAGAWIWASAFDLKWATVAIIVVSAALAITAIVRAGRGAAKDEWLVRWPVGLLAGWLTIASAVNLLTVLTAEGYVRSATALPAALGGIAAVVLVTIFGLRKSRLPAYGLPVAWGFVAVFVAERGDQPIVGWAALAAAALVLLQAGASARATSGRR